MSEHDTPPGYLLGEMAATVRSIDANVTAIRQELGDITRRLGDVEQDMATLKAERTAMMPEYQAFVKTVRQHMSDTDAWKSRADGALTTAKGGGKILHTVLAALFTLALFIAGQMWNADRQAEPSGASQIQR